MAKFHPLLIKSVRRETEEAVSIEFEVPEDLSSLYQYDHGQNLTLKAIIDGEDVRRTYSICTSPAEGSLKVAIKQQPFGKFSTFANTLLKEGDQLEVMPPTGNFNTRVSPDQAKSYVAFAAGSGITPIMSIMKTVLETEPESTFSLFYGNKAIDSIIFREEIEDLKNTYLNRLSVYHILSREKQESILFNGRIDAEKVNSFSNFLIDPDRVDEYFICGPAEMIHEVSESLKTAGVPEKKIHFELFTSPLDHKKFSKADDRPAQVFSGEESNVTVIVDGLSTVFNLKYDGESILNQALSEGVDLPFACKGGVCATCKARIVEGKAEMDVNYALVDEEVKAGFVLTCQAHPRSEKLLVDFDI